METNKVYLGDCLTTIKTFPDNSIDSIVTDPPYELGFMGKSWDNTGIANNVDLWRECLRVLKPGGHLLSFSGTRTYHRMASAIEDAGFEIRDMIEWVYGSGFPKSLNIAKMIEGKLVLGSANTTAFKHLKGEREKIVNGYTKMEFEQGNKPANYNDTENGGSVTKPEFTTEEAKQWSGWGTALKPAHEPICMARKPLAEKTVAENVLKYGTGGINIDESRVDYQSEADKASATPQGKCTSNTSAGSAPDVDMSEVNYQGEKYWYKNEYKWLIDKWLNDEDYVWSELKENLETYDWCKVPDIEDGDRVLFDSAEGICIRLYESKRKEFDRPEQLGRFPANLLHDNSEEVRECFPETGKGNGKGAYNYAGKEYDNKDTSMFNGDKPQAPSNFNDSGNASRFFKSILYYPKASKRERNKGCEGLEKGCSHPTVKPIALMEYLIKMVTKEGGIVLDPFAGSGTTLVAAKQNGYQYIGCELTEEYIPIIEARLNATEEDVTEEGPKEISLF